MSNHPAEMVERVMQELAFAWAGGAKHGWRDMARYALNLASRASIISTLVAADPAWKDRAATTAFASECVRRAVEA